MFLFLHQKTCKNDTPPLSGERLLEHIVYNLLLVSSKQTLQTKNTSFWLFKPKHEWKVTAKLSRKMSCSRQWTIWQVRIQKVIYAVLDATSE